MDLRHHFQQPFRLVPVENAAIAHFAEFFRGFGVAHRSIGDSLNNMGYQVR
jgi:hypothetical protein